MISIEFDEREFIAHHDMTIDAFNARFGTNFKAKAPRPPEQFVFDFRRDDPVQEDSFHDVVDVVQILKNTISELEDALLCIRASIAADFAEGIDINIHEIQRIIRAVGL